MNKNLYENKKANCLRGLTLKIKLLITMQKKLKRIKKYKKFFMEYGF